MLGDDLKGANHSGHRSQEPQKRSDRSDHKEGGTETLHSGLLSEELFSSPIKQGITIRRIPLKQTTADFSRVLQWNGDSRQQ